MEQMKIAADQIVNINYEDESLPAHVRNFRPIVFVDDELYYCLFGSELQHGVLGYGETIKEAIDRWTRELEYRIRNAA
jgi:hypothetical protein